MCRGVTTPPYADRRASASPAPGAYAVSATDQISRPARPCRRPAGPISADSHRTSRAYPLGRPQTVLIDRRAPVAGRTSCTRGRQSEMSSGMPSCTSWLWTFMYGRPSDVASVLKRELDCRASSHHRSRNRPVPTSESKRVECLGKECETEPDFRPMTTMGKTLTSRAQETGV